MLANASTSRIAEKYKPVIGEFPQDVPTEWSFLQENTDVSWVPIEKVDDRMRKDLAQIAMHCMPLNHHLLRPMNNFLASIPHQCRDRLRFTPEFALNPHIPAYGLMNQMLKRLIDEQIVVQSEDDLTKVPPDFLHVAKNLYIPPPPGPETEETQSILATMADYKSFVSCKSKNQKIERHKRQKSQEVQQMEKLKREEKEDVDMRESESPPPAKKGKGTGGGAKGKGKKKTGSIEEPVRKKGRSNSMPTVVQLPQSNKSTVTYDFKFFVELVVHHVELETTTLGQTPYGSVPNNKPLWIYTQRRMVRRLFVKLPGRLVHLHVPSYELSVKLPLQKWKLLEKNTSIGSSIDKFRSALAPPGLLTSSQNHDPDDEDPIYGRRVPDDEEVHWAWHDTSEGYRRARCWINDQHPYNPLKTIQPSVTIQVQKEIRTMQLPIPPSAVHMSPNEYGGHNSNFRQNSIPMGCFDNLPNNMTTVVSNLENIKKLCRYMGIMSCTSPKFQHVIYQYYLMAPAKTATCPSLTERGVTSIRFLRNWQQREAMELIRMDKEGRWQFQKLTITNSEILFPNSESFGNAKMHSRIDPDDLLYDEDTQGTTKKNSSNRIFGESYSHSDDREGDELDPYVAEGGTEFNLEMEALELAEHPDDEMLKKQKIANENRRAIDLRLRSQKASVESKKRATQTMITYRPEETYSLFHQAMPFSMYPQAQSGGLETHKLSNHVMKEFLVKTQNAATSMAEGEPHLMQLFSFYLSRIYCPMAVVLMAMGVMEDSLLEDELEQIEDPMERKAILQILMHSLSFNMGCTTPDEARMYLGMVLFTAEVWTDYDLIEAGKYFILHRFYPQMTYRGPDLMAMEELSPLQRMEYKYKWIFRNKQHLYLRHWISYLRVHLGFDQPHSVRSLINLKACVPAERLASNFSKTLGILSRRINQGVRAHANLYHTMYGDFSKVIVIKKRTPEIKQQQTAAEAMTTNQVPEFVSMIDRIQTQSDISMLGTRMIAKFATERDMKNRKFDSAGPLYRMMDGYNEIQEARMRGAFVPTNSKRSTKQEQEAKPDECGYLCQLDTPFNDGGSSSKSLAMLATVSEQQYIEDNNFLMRVFAEIEQKDPYLFNCRDIWTCKTDYGRVHPDTGKKLTWVAVCHLGGEPVGYTCYPKRLRSILRRLKGQRYVPPGIKTMTVVWKRRFHVLEWRTDMGRLCQLKICADVKKGKICIPNSLLKIWSMSPSSRVEHFLPWIDTLPRYPHPTGGMEIASSHVRDVSPPYYQYFSDLMMAGTFEFFDPQELEFETVGTNMYHGTQRSIYDIHMGGTVSPASTLFPFVPHAAMNRIELGCRKNASGHTWGPMMCHQCGQPRIPGKDVQYVLVPSSCARNEFGAAVMKDIPIGNVTPTIVLAVGNNQDDALVKTESFGNIVIWESPVIPQEKVYKGKNVIFHRFKENAKYISDYKDKFESGRTVPMKNATEEYKMIYNCAKSLYYARLSDQEEIAEHGLPWIPDPADLFVPFIVRDSLIRTYHTNSAVEEMLGKVRNYHPHFNMMTPGKRVSSNEYLMTALRIMPDDMMLPILDQFGRLTLHPNVTTPENLEHHLDLTQKIFVLKQTKGKAMNLSCPSHLDGGIIESVHLNPTNDSHQSLIVLFIVSIVLDMIGSKWVTKIMDKGVLAEILFRFMSYMNSRGVIPEIIANPSGVITRQNLARIVELVYQRFCIQSPYYIMPSSQTSNWCTVGIDNAGFQKDDGPHMYERLKKAYIPTHYADEKEFKKVVDSTVSEEDYVPAEKPPQEWEIDDHLHNPAVTGWVRFERLKDGLEQFMQSYSPSPSTHKSVRTEHVNDIPLDILIGFTRQLAETYKRMHVFIRQHFTPQQPEEAWVAKRKPFVKGRYPYHTTHQEQFVTDLKEYQQYWSTFNLIPSGSVAHKKRILLTMPFPLRQWCETRHLTSKPCQMWQALNKYVMEELFHMSSRTLQSLVSPHEVQLVETYDYTLETIVFTCRQEAQRIWKHAQQRFLKSLQPHQGEGLIEECYEEWWMYYFNMPPSLIHAAIPSPEQVESFWRTWLNPTVINLWVQKRLFPVLESALSSLWRSPLTPPQWMEFQQVMLFPILRHWSEQVQSIIQQWVQTERQHVKIVSEQVVYYNCMWKHWQDGLLRTLTRLEPKTSLTIQEQRIYEIWTPCLYKLFERTYLKGVKWNRFESYTCPAFANSTLLYCPGWILNLIDLAGAELHPMLFHRLPDERLGHELEVFISGVTGNLIESRIIFGYQDMRHVDFGARQTAKMHQANVVNLNDNSAVSKSKIGASKEGYMEKDAKEAHGASEVYSSTFLRNSSNRAYRMCKNCDESASYYAMGEERDTLPIHIHHNKFQIPQEPYCPICRSTDPDLFQIAWGQNLCDLGHILSPLGIKLLLYKNEKESDRRPRLPRPDLFIEDDL